MYMYPLTLIVIILESISNPSIIRNVVSQLQVLWYRRHPSPVQGSIFVIFLLSSSSLVFIRRCVAAPSTSIATVAVQIQPPPCHRQADPAAVLAAVAAQIHPYPRLHLAAIASPDPTVVAVPPGLRHGCILRLSRLPSQLNR